MDLGLRGKRALVCAASKGLGRAITLALADEGCQLFLCARTPEPLEATATEARTRTDQPVHTLACDLSSMAGRDQLIQAVNAVWPQGPQVLIHNVGGPRPATMAETTLADWEQAFQQLLMSILHLNEAFLPRMTEAGWGRIVNITSLSVMEPIAGLALSNGFRPAIAAMSKTLADEVAAKGVTINSIAPGIIYTDRTEERIAAAIARSGGSREEHLAQYAKSIPAGRLGKPEELAAAVVFLCSEPAAYITGSTLCVDGGKRRSAH
jgi:3-oxoacyl-[acyl-carrier protein] reductase